jgi:hypothetical protein
MILGSIIGFIISGALRHLRHFVVTPRDVLNLIPFLIITTFVLTVVEWYGNLTLKESDWMTRKLDA